MVWCGILEKKDKTEIKIKKSSVRTVENALKITGSIVSVPSPDYYALDDFQITKLRQ